ncbi:WapI family immunity protein [Bradyrhizobium betae]|jgi:hypothetical protein
MNSVEPDLKLGGFSLWVFGRQFPNATDYWDGNWLNVRARIEAPGAVVQAQGSFVFAPDLASFTQQLETLYAALAGEARLRSLEPNLEITIQCGTGGHVAAKFMITPDHMTQSHEFEFYLDQTYLGPLLDGCRNVLLRWPVRPQTST